MVDGEIPDPPLAGVWDKYPAALRVGFPATVLAESLALGGDRRS